MERIELRHQSALLALAALVEALGMEKTVFMRDASIMIKSLLSLFIPTCLVLQKL